MLRVGNRRGREKGGVAWLPLFLSVGVSIAAAASAANAAAAAPPVPSSANITLQVLQLSSLN